MTSFASAMLAAALTVAVAAPAIACPMTDKQASLTDSGSYKTAQKDQSSSQSK